MTAMETAEALNKLVMANGVRDAIGYGDLTKLSKEIGKSDRYIQDHLNLLKQSDITKEVFWIRLVLQRATACLIYIDI